MKKVAYVDYGDAAYLHGEGGMLFCCVCGENDRDKLIVEGLMLGKGPCGDDYSFCAKCWKSKTLGDKIMKVLDISPGLKMLDEFVKYYIK